MGEARPQQPPAVPTVTLQVGEWRWTVLPEWHEALDHARDIPWGSLDGCEGAELLKDNDLRGVWRVRVGERTMVAKVCQPPSGWARLKPVLSGPPGRREFRAALYGRQHKLNVVRPIAYGRHRSGITVFLAELIEDTQSLSDYWQSQAHASGHRTLAVDNKIVSRAAAFLEQLHRNKFIPTDLHPDNILVTRNGDFMLVDLHKARFGVTANQVLRILNLADLNQWFRRHAGRTARLRFLLAYLTCAVERPSPRLIRKYVEEVNEVSGWKAEKLQKKRDKRIFGDNNYFGVLALPNDWTAHVYLQAKRPVGGSPCSQLQFAKSDWAAALEQILGKHDDPDPTELHIGRHEVPIEVERARERSDGLRDRWQREHRKINRHQSVPLPLALLEHRAGDRQTAVLITERSNRQ